MLLRPAVLAAIERGEVDLAFRRWDRPRVVVGTRMQTGVGLVEVTAVDRVAASRITAAEAHRAGAATAAELRALLTGRTGDVYRVGLRHAGPDPRDALRVTVPTAEEARAVRARLDRLDRASSTGPWTQQTLELIDRHPTVRAPDLAAVVGRPTADFKRDVRKLKELGLTESFDIGYRLSPRGQAVLDADGVRCERGPALAGSPWPRIGAPATRALRAAGYATLEDLDGAGERALAALHGVGPLALDRLREALARAGLRLAP
ncbi:hypothetical protein [Jannaschia sp. R86511]|uniref:hypothetical protein n=1 Tax=Jannaschia sp. R86511 TaxID=3093853 RepID=UPI0036D30B09